ncbi:MAG: hypothetical protein EBQ57_07535 [Actinobacteria bacterium]|nr:hypothetical protein [Actinomycetota bacterium]
MLYFAPLRRPRQYLRPARSSRRRHRAAALDLELWRPASSNELSDHLIEPSGLQRGERAAWLFFALFPFLPCGLNFGEIWCWFIEGHALSLTMHTTKSHSLGDVRRSFVGMQRKLGRAVRGAIVAVVTASATIATPTPAAAVVGGTSALGNTAVVRIINGSSSCSGALWTSRIVVTAGHCVVNSSGRVTTNQVSVFAPGVSTQQSPQTVSQSQIIVVDGFRIVSDSHNLTTLPSSCSPANCPVAPSPVSPRPTKSPRGVAMGASSPFSATDARHQAALHRRCRSASINRSPQARPGPGHSRQHKRRPRESAQATLVARSSHRSAPNSCSSASTRQPRGLVHRRAVRR